MENHINIINRLQYISNTFIPNIIEPLKLLNDYLTKKTNYQVNEIICENVKFKSGTLEIETNKEFNDRCNQMCKIFIAFTNYKSITIKKINCPGFEEHCKSNNINFSSL